MPERLRPLLLIAAFTLLIVLCARIEVPMVPVPMTMQTFAVLLAGAVLGPVRVTGAVMLYLVLAAAGLPVLADGASGLAPFSGPTAGYLLAFPLAAFGTGRARRAGWLDRVWPATVFLIVQHLLILALGTLWLSRQLDLGTAVSVGFMPFVVGAGVKSLLVALVSNPLRRWAEHWLRGQPQPVRAV